MSDESGTSISDNSSENQSYEECIRIRKSHSKTVSFSRKLSCSSQTYLREIEAAEATLLEIQSEESKEFERFSLLWRECELLEQLFQHVIQYVDCVKLQMKTTNKLSILLNDLTLRENCLTKSMSQNLKELCQEPDISPWTDLNSTIYNFMEKLDGIKDMRRKFDEDMKNYQIALKNFKMVLEFMSINLKDLDKLKKQFEQVLWDYQHSRCLLIRNMMQVKESGLEFLGGMCGSLGRKNDVNKDVIGQLNYLLGDIEKAFHIESQYTREVFCSNDMELNKTK